MTADPSLSFPASLYWWPKVAGPWIRANLIVGADWLWSLDGVSGGLGNASDLALFTYLRDTADVVVVGGGTARSEDYSGARRSRITGGVPALVVVGSSASKFDPEAALFRDVLVPTDVVVQKDDDYRGLDDVPGARVHRILGDDWARGVGEWLKNRGYRRILLEGGPGVFDAFAEAGLIDECCVTRSPVSAAPGQETAKYRPTWLGGVQRAWADQEGFVGEIRTVKTRPASG